MESRANGESAATAQGWVRPVPCRGSPATATYTYRTYRGVSWWDGRPSQCESEVRQRTVERPGPRRLSLSLSLSLFTFNAQPNDQFGRYHSQTAGATGAWLTVGRRCTIRCGTTNNGSAGLRGAGQGQAPKHKGVGQPGADHPCTNRRPEPLEPAPKQSSKTVSLLAASRALAPSSTHLRPAWMQPPTRSKRHGCPRRCPRTRRPVNSAQRVEGHHASSCRDAQGSSQGATPRATDVADARHPCTGLSTLPVPPRRFQHCDVAAQTLATSDCMSRCVRFRGCDSQDIIQPSTPWTPCDFAPRYRLRTRRARLWSHAAFPPPSLLSRASYSRRMCDTSFELMSMRPCIMGYLS
jgi:hypothetical protein